MNDGERGNEEEEMACLRAVIDEECKRPLNEYAWKIIALYYELLERNDNETARKENT